MKIAAPSYEKYLEDYAEALEELQETISQYLRKPADEKSQTKIIRLFELTHEMALKMIGEYFRKQGRAAFSGSRDATVEAFNEELIDDGKGWLDMIIDRIQYNPLYEADTQHMLSEKIAHKYIRLLENFQRKISAKLE